MSHFVLDSMIQTLKTMSSLSLARQACIPLSGILDKGVIMSQAPANVSGTHFLPGCSRSAFRSAAQAHAQNLAIFSFLCRHSGCGRVSLGPKKGEHTRASWHPVSDAITPWWLQVIHAHGELRLSVSRGNELFVALAYDYNLPWRVHRSVRSFCQICSLFHLYGFF